MSEPDILINKYGTLYLNRAGLLKPMTCKFSPIHHTDCRDDCPLFGNPAQEYVEVFGTIKETHKKLLTICQGRVLAGTIADERKTDGQTSPNEG